MANIVDPVRPAFIKYLKGLKLGDFKVTENLPWIENGRPLYFNNRKTIYVDNPNTSQQPLSDAFNQAGFVEEMTIVGVYFVTDAKTLPSNYDYVVDVVKDLRTIAMDGATQRLAKVTTSYVADDLVTVFEFSFKTVLTN